MVAGKVKLPMPFHKSPSPSHPPPSPSKSSFTRALGAYFPRSSAQVQPRPPDVAELLRLVDDLRDRESRLKTQLLEHKLLKQTAAIVPLLENDIVSRDAEILCQANTIQDLQAENQRLAKELHELRLRSEQEKRENECKTKALEDEIAELKKTASEHANDHDLSSSQRFHKFLNKTLKKTVSSDQGSGNQKQLLECSAAAAVLEDFKPQVPGSEKHSEELPDTFTNAVTSRQPRVPKPPPRRSSSSSPHSPLTASPHSSTSDNHNAGTEQPIQQPPKLGPPPPPPPPKAAASMSSKTAPPPPPPPPKGSRAVTAKVTRVPEVVEFYHTLMRREPSQLSRRECSSNGIVEAVPAPANARDMIGEIENRSSHLLAIKTDVETQADFIRCLIKEVEEAAFADIEDVVLFVKWLDDELSYLVDERAVLKHFEWPEQKADALREAAFGYCDLKKLEREASSFRDDPRQPCGPALKKMQALFDKLEHGVYNISRMRESATNRYKLFRIPLHWILDSGFVSQIKLASVKLAMKYMKRVSAELETVGGGPEEEELIVQGVRFAFRVHQFAGGFDVETMRAFQELRDKARSGHVQQQKFLCRSATC
ncbi:protein CHUP1, chloroplastic-like [Arachis stenosperma]|uniref:protein CHUP1, chloroplastic-like n=1 Tax=Arachis stenosperma TaxID=217475 RepID=UPI0025AC4C5D|nr:protein CHUP1, chloroplastic-like [Arachis stenosperma]